MQRIFVPGHRLLSTCAWALYQISIIHFPVFHPHYSWMGHVLCIHLIRSRLGVLSDSVPPAVVCQHHLSTLEAAQGRPTLTGDKGLAGPETCCPASPCEAESRASDWLPVTSHSWLPFSPDEHLLYVSSPFTIATRHNRKKTSGAVPSAPGSGFLTAPSTKRPLHVYSVGFPTRVIAVGGADFVFCFICCLHGAAIEVTNSHIIAALGSNYLKTNSFPESSSLFSLHSALSFQKIISGGKKFKLLIVPPAPLSGD